MAARLPVRPIGPYDTRTLMNTVAHLPTFDRWVLPHGMRSLDPAVLNPTQPIILPEMASGDDNLLYAEDVPIEIELGAKGRLISPQSLCRLRWAVDLQRWKLDLFVSAFGETNLSWAEIKAPEAHAKAALRAAKGFEAQGLPVSMARFREDCRSSAAKIIAGEGQTLPGAPGAARLHDRQNAWLKRQREILVALGTAERHRYDVHRGFAKLHLRASRDHQLLSLGGLHEPYRRLPKGVSLEHMLDTAFFGLINPVVIYANFVGLSDLLALARALGLANLGFLWIGLDEARTFLSTVMMEGDPVLNLPAQFRAMRRMMTKIMIDRYDLASCTDTIAQICREVEASGREYQIRKRLWPLI